MSSACWFGGAKCFRHNLLKKGPAFRPAFFLPTQPNQDDNRRPKVIPFACLSPRSRHRRVRSNTPSTWPAIFDELRPLSPRWKCNHDKVTHLFCSSSRTRKSSSNRGHNFGASTHLRLDRNGIHRMSRLAVRTTIWRPPFRQLSSAPRMAEPFKCPSLVVARNSQLANWRPYSSSLRRKLGFSSTARLTIPRGIRPC
jgi:hypothetical protein